MEMRSRFSYIVVLGLLLLPLALKGGVSQVLFSGNHRGLANDNSINNDQKLYLVLDIDWTLVTPLNNEQAYYFIGDKRLLQVGDEYYLLKEGARELLETAFADPKIEVSFFSGGGHQRNEKLLKSLYLTNGRTAWEESYRVLSRRDLTVVSQDQSLRFSERFKKDIRKVHPDLTRVLLIEDLAHFALGDGVDNTLWLGQTYFPPFPQQNFSESVRMWRSLGVEARYLAETQEADWWARRKLFVLQALLETFDSPEEILEKAKELGYSEELAPKDVHLWLERASSYKRFIDQTPCSIAPLL